MCGKAYLAFSHFYLSISFVIQIPGVFSITGLDLCLFKHSWL